ncbi:MAG TPA: RNA polymerase sigma factor [Solirubrobacteraceae bacterium]|nr:RNA polymerase sigma factor [Solirubrobacteraceae bacterium]
MDDVDRRGTFEELFAAHHWAVRGYVVRRAPAAAVEDVVAETFLVAWRRLETLRDDPLPWLLGVARRVLANQQRAERRRGALTDRLQGLLPGSSPEWEPPAAMSDELAAAMVRLSPQEREALLLVAWEGLDGARAARAAGCSPTAFRARLHRARRRVAASLADPALHPHSSVAGESS